MKRGTTDAETCALNGWAVGTLLVGDEGYGPTVIRITAIGDERMLAVTESHNGKPARDTDDGLWRLGYRDWSQVGAA